MRFSLGGGKGDVLSEHLARNPALRFRAELELLAAPNGKKESVPCNLGCSLLAAAPLYLHSHSD